MSPEIVATIYTATIRMTTPILLAALGGALTYHAGKVSVAMEGLMLASSFSCVVFSYLAGNAFVGVLAGIATAITLSLFNALFVSILKVDNFAVGFALNIFASSLTLFLTRVLFVGQNVFNSPEIVPVRGLGIVTGIDFLDNYILSFSVLTYLSLISVFVVSYLVFKTRYGLHLRVAGEKPEVLEAAGIRSSRAYILASIGCGILCGLAGAQLSLYNVRMFTRDMTGGRGFVALAAILMARGKPLLLFFVCLLFGFFDALSLRLQGAALPPQFSLMLPYIVSIVALVFFCIKDKKSTVIIDEEW